MEQRENAHTESYMLYPNSQYGAAYLTHLPGNGLMPAQIPWNKLSHNAADTESFLFGIGSTNLVAPKPCFYPEPTILTVSNIYENKPTYIPEPLITQKNQRPFPV
jgi:hypothetical protein